MTDIDVGRVDRVALAIVNRSRIDIGKSKINSLNEITVDLASAYRRQAVDAINAAKDVRSPFSDLSDMFAVKKSPADGDLTVDLTLTMNKPPQVTVKRGDITLAQGYVVPNA